MSITTGRKESLPHRVNQFLKTLHAVNKQTDVLRTKDTKKDYSRRRVIVEPVFAQMKVKQKTVKLSSKPGPDSGHTLPYA